MKIPTVSIIMPVRNEEKFIDRSLTAVINQEYPQEKIEIIVIDGMSNDRTISIITKIFANLDKYKCKLFYNKLQIFSTGFNIGLKNANGEVIIMVGGHTEISKDYIKKCVNYLYDLNIDCVGGRTITIGDNFLSKAISGAMSSIFGVGNVAFRTGATRIREVDTVAFGAYKAATFKKFGSIDEEMVRNQDDEFNYRIRKLGGKILFAPNLVVKYYSRSSLLTLWKQYFRYGYWKVLVLQKHPRQMRIRQFIPPAFVFFLVVSGILSQYPFFWSTAFTLIAGSYVSANILASIITAAKSGWKHIFLLPIVFAILHLSYGMGFLVGLIKFANRWRQTKVSPVVQSE